MLNHAFNIAAIFLTVAVLSIASTPPVPPMPVVREIRLEDAKAFKVSSPEVSSKRCESMSHAGTMRAVIWQNNGPDVSGQWEADCAYRARVWDLLDDVIVQTHFPLERRLCSLTALRELLGDADYYAGRMPAPVPTYRK